MRKEDVIGSPRLLAQWQAKQDRRKARKAARIPTPHGQERIPVKKVFEEVLSGMKKEAEVRLTDYYSKLAEETKVVEGLTHDKANFELRKKRGFRWGNSYYATDATKFQYDLLKWSCSSFMTGIASMKPANEIKKYITDKVTADVQAMFESFINKQTEKVNGILKGRKVHVHSKVYPNLEGTFQFDLEDGSKFLMKTQVVWKMSQKGKRFWQFPTTFHNAIKANGMKIGTPSEAALKKEL